MRLHHLRLTNFRGVRDVQVAFASPGITVVLADNEAGKSSLLEAVDKLFRLPDDSKTRDLRAVQPVGRDVGTTVEAHLELGGHQVTYRKTWFRDRATELVVDGRALTGREAHDAATDLFGRHVDPHLWDALVVGQDASLVQPTAREVTPLLTALSRSSGVDDPDENSPEESSLTLAIEKEYRRYFTAKDGRVTGELAEAEKELAEATTAAETSRAAAAQVERTVVEAERLERERVVLREQRDANDQQLGRLRTRLTAAELAESTLSQAGTRADLARVRAGTAQAVAEQRAVDVARLLGSEVAAADLATLLAAAEDAAADADDALIAARTDDESARSAVRAARADLASWHRADSHRRDTDSLEQLRARIAAVENARSSERRLRAEADDILVTPTALELVEALQRELALAEARAQASAPRITVRKLGRAGVTVGQGHTVTTVSKAAPHDAAVTETVVVTVAGAAEITILPPAGAAGDVQSELARNRTSIADMLTELGADDADDLRAQVRRRDDLVRAADDAVGIAKAHLGADTLDALTALRDRLLDAAAEAAVPADPTLADPTSAGHTLEEAERRIAAADLTAEATSSALRRCQVDSEQTREQVVEVRVRHEEAVRRLDTDRAQVAAERARAADATVLAAADLAITTAAAADADLERAREAFEGSGLAGVADAHARALEVAEQLDHQLTATSDEWSRAQGRLDDAGAAGLATSAEQAEGRFEQASDRHALVRRRADAVARLRVTLARHSASARLRYADPLKQRIEALGRVAFGPSFAVTLSDDLDVVDRSLDGDLMPVAWLSTGAKEQLAIVVRMAIASLTGLDDGGVPLILDDALGWSDPGRLRQMHRLLGEAARSQQIILLTSQWSRYNLIPGVGEPVRLRSAG
ncbi:MAG TPA: AAA family ATPase [Actinopolymorphaceae bacterium]|jgi:hypothetical protein